MKDIKTPTNLIYFVTNHCQLNCVHCFYYKYLNKKLHYLSLTELRKIVKLLVSPLNLLILTGGEPFLRKDLDCMCYIFSELNHTKVININSNGWETNYIYETVKDIRRKMSRRTKLSIQISIDGLEQAHDKIRKHGSFKKAIETVNKLKTIKNLNLSIMTTVCKFNYNEIKDLISFVRNLGVKHKYQFVRDNRKNVFNLKKEFLTNFQPQEEDFFLSLEDLYKINSLIDEFEEDVRQKIKRKSVIKSIVSRKRILPCLAGLNNAVLYSNGDVSFCEPLKPFLNIRDFGHNFRELWSSTKAQEMRGCIKDCSCADPCNLLLSIYKRAKI